MINCIKYIHRNPVKAKIEAACGDYQYSSYNEYANNARYLYDDIEDVCDFTKEEINDIIKNSNTAEELLQDEKSEELRLLFESLKNEYKIDDLTDREIFEIFQKLNERYQVTKSKVAELLNIKRSTLVSKLKNSNF